jgi:hypothetical protein
VSTAQATYGPPTIRASASLVTGAVAIGALFLFYWLRNSWLCFFQARPHDIYLLFCASAVIAGAFFWVTYHRLEPAFATLTRITALGIAVYLLVEPPEFTLANPKAANLALYVDRAYWVALAASIAGIWRPSFIFPAALYIMSTRELVSWISFVPISTLDIRYMAEMAQFLSLSVCALTLLSKARAKFSFLHVVDIRLLALCLAFIAFGFHLGNYFWSGIAKLTIGPHWWSWALENNTQNALIGALKRGVLLTGPFPSITQWLFDTFGSVVVITNSFVLAIQLFAIVAIIRVRLLMLVTLAYDAFHIGIYVLGGLFFWPWIWNNCSILFSLKGYRDCDIGWVPKACCAITIIMGGIYSLGDSARLAWFDVLDIKIPSIQAQAPDGTWVDVPVSFFLTHSYSISHGYLDFAVTPGHYMPSRWGSVDSYVRNAASGKCIPPRMPARPESEKNRYIRLAKVNAFLRAHHKKMLNSWVPLSYYFRSHHHPSNPWLYADFNGLDLALGAIALSRSRRA